MVALYGRIGQGKTTFLKLLGRSMLLQSGAGDGVAYFPTHVRSLFVSNRPIFFHGTLVENLCWGSTHRSVEESIKRTKRVCRAVGLGPEILAGLESKEAGWMDCLTAGQQQLICVARALMFDPELLCLQRPTITLGHAASHKVLKALRNYVDQRGLFVSLLRGKKCLRWPHTVIMTLCTPRRELAGIVDHIFVVWKEKIEDFTDRTIEELDKVLHVDFGEDSDSDQGAQLMQSSKSEASQLPACARIGSGESEAS